MQSEIEQIFRYESLPIPNFIHKQYLGNERGTVWRRVIKKLFWHPSSHMIEKEQRFAFRMPNFEVNL